MRNPIQKGPTRSVSDQLSDHIAELATSLTQKEWRACQGVMSVYVPLPRDPRTANVSAQLETLTYETRIALAQRKADKDQAYRERNQLVALLCSVFPTKYGKTDIEGWSEDWHHCVALETPSGQLSWHVRDDQVDLFPDAGEWSDTLEWDGHTTAEKYKRVEALAIEVESCDDHDFRGLTVATVRGWLI